MRILVSGSHGLIGSALVSKLRGTGPQGSGLQGTSMQGVGNEVVRLVRHAPQPGDLTWDQVGSRTNLEAFEGFDAVIHLAGYGIGEKRWRAKEMRKIRDSRVLSTRALAELLAQTVQRPKVFLCASAVGYYGNRGDEELSDQASRGNGFLAEVCQEWEAACAPAEAEGIRVANLRSGIVLDAKGGALAKQLPLFKLAIGGRLGPGTQWMSWISLSDEVRAIDHVLTHKSLKGPINLVGPNPVTNAEFTALLGYALRRPTIFPGPRWMLVTAFGRQLTDEVFLASQRAVPEKLSRSGFHFENAELLPTLQEMLETAPTGSDDGGPSTNGDTKARGPKTKWTMRSAKRKDR